MAHQRWKEGPMEILWAKLLRFQSGKLRPREEEGMEAAYSYRFHSL